MKNNHLVSIRLPFSIYKYIKENGFNFSKFCRSRLIDYLFSKKFMYSYDFTQKRRYSWDDKVRINFYITDKLYELCKEQDLEFTNFIINQLEFYIKEKAVQLRIMAIKENKNLALEIEKLERDLDMLRSLQFVYGSH